MEHSQANINALRSDMKKQIRECLSMSHMPWNYIHQEELLYGT